MSTSKSSAGSRRRRLAAARPRCCVANRGTRGPIGYDYVHTAIDDHTRLAYAEIHPDEKDATCAGFLHRAMAWFAAHGIPVRRVLTDNALVYRHGTDWGWVCSAGSSNAASPSPAALDQRQSRTLQPHPAQRVGLCPPLDQQRLRRRGLNRFLRPLQHSTRPLRPRRTTTHQPARRLTTTCQVTTASHRSPRPTILLLCQPCRTTVLTEPPDAVARTHSEPGARLILDLPSPLAQRVSAPRCRGRPQDGCRDRTNPEASSIAPQHQHCEGLGSRSSVTACVGISDAHLRLARRTDDASVRAEHAAVILPRPQDTDRIPGTRRGTSRRSAAWSQPSACRTAGR